jgi:diphthine synthase
MLYLIGLGLNRDGISKFGLDALSRCKKVYLENYTVNFPYPLSDIQELAPRKKIIMADREKVESLELVDEAKKLDVALLVYGSPLTATTHITIVQECERLGIRSKVIYAASILDAVAESGLQLYKFGKTASMPKWDVKKNFTPDSFMNIVKENQSIGAHTLLLVDISLWSFDALAQLKQASKKHDMKLGKIILCQALGTSKARFLYHTVDKLEENTSIHPPYCFVIPGKLHFVEKEVIENLALNF